MKSVRNCVELIIILIVIGAATYSQRSVISDWLRMQTQPSLPSAVEYQDVVMEQNKLDAVTQQDEDKNKFEETQVVTNENKEETNQPVVDKEMPVVSEQSPDSNNTVLPSAFNLAVPFTSQAPDGNWSEPYKEACEEASLYMVHEYYQGTGGGAIKKETANKNLLQIVEFEKQLFGFYEDTTAEQTGTLAEMMFGYSHAEILAEPTIEQIKSHVAAGRPVIVPAAGRELGNPYFTAPGPIYHMLVIRGYTQEGQFITNDPGTKHGEQYLYTFDTLMNAMHDWNGDQDITEGKKVVLVVYPN